ncbi:MAG: transposase, partial [Myxococcota bacterium]
PRPRVSRHVPLHVTMGVLPEARGLRRDRVLGALRASFRAERDRLGFRLVHYAIQHDHWHLLVEADDDRALARGMMRLNIRCARALNRLAGRRGRVFRDRYFAQPLRTPKTVRNALAYVLLNHRRHVAKAGRRPHPRPEADFYSSGAAFDGWRGDTPPATCDEMAVAPPRCWLLGQGWRRHGLIRLDEVPGRPAG